MHFFEYTKNDLVLPKRLIFQKQKRNQEALIAYEKGFSIDNEYAELTYQIAECLYNIEQYDLAKNYYRMAKELDICPLRAPPAINNAIKEIGK